MIVPTMTLPEIHAELLKDCEDIQASVEHKIKLFGSVVLKSSRYPVVRRYAIKSKNRRNVFYVRFTAFKRGFWKNPAIHTYCIYSRPEGLHCAFLDPIHRASIIFPPHFFSRYRERIVRDDSLGTEELIHLFSSRTWALSFQPVSAEVQQMMRQWRGYPRDMDVPIVAFGPDGMLFGQCTGHVTLVKTIVSPSMLHEDQVPVYESLRDCYHRKLRDYYPREEAEWLMGMEKGYGW